MSAFFCGWLFALGLGIAGMTRPRKIIGFLDVAGQWDAALLFVMAGAVAVGFFLFPVVLRRAAPVLDERFRLPETLPVDFRLVAGAAIFGVGWGLSGFCPGPALVSLVTLSPASGVFVLAMIAGLALGNRISR